MAPNPPALAVTGDLTTQERESVRHSNFQALIRVARDRTEIFFDLLRIHRPLINLDDGALLIDQKGTGNSEISMAVEKIPIGQTINSCNIFGAHNDGKRQSIVTRVGPNRRGRALVVDIARDQLESLRYPSRVNAIEHF